MQRLMWVVGVWCLLALGAVWAVAQPVGTGARPVPDHVLLSWTGNPATTQTISWRTDTTVTSGLVEYSMGITLTAGHRVTATKADFTTDLGTAHLFTATLTGLTPNTAYVYHVGDGTQWSDTHTFHTANPQAGSFQFLVFGDSQSGIPDQVNYEPWRTTVQHAFAKHPHARFLINMGDLVEVGQSGAHWNAWFEAAHGVIDTIPEMAVQGNHETYRPNIAAHSLDAGKPVNFSAQFPLPQNGPAELQGQVYSYDYGNVHFAVLDSQEEEEQPVSGDILAVQQRWLDADLAVSQARWKLVLFHKTPYYTKASRANEAIKAAFCPIIEKYHANLVFNGHDHSISRTYAIAHDTLMARPSQGTIYLTTGRSGNKAYPDLTKKYWNTFCYNPQDQPVYLLVTVEGTTLTVTTYKQDETLVDTFTIDQTKDIDSDTALYPPPNTSWVQFAQPILAVYGNLLSPTMIYHAPLLRDGVWYVDAQAFAAYLGATLTPQGDTAIIAMAGKSIVIPASQLLMDRGTLLLSADGLKALGFSSTFHAENNILSVVK